MKKIILASGSPRRRELLAQIGLEYKVITSNADETSKSDKPALMVMELSAKKAQAVWDTLSEEEKAESVVIGADTIVYDGDTVLGKPTDKVDAFCMIRKLAGNSHSVFTGVSFIIDDNITSFCEETKVNVYSMTEQEISDYIATGEPMDKAGVPICNSHKYCWEGKAGGYGIQDVFGAKFVKSIEGDYNNVVGLPTSRLYHELKKLNII